MQNIIVSTAISHPSAKTTESGLTEDTQATWWTLLKNGIGGARWLRYTWNIKIRGSWNRICYRLCHMYDMVNANKNLIHWGLGDFKNKFRKVIFPLVLVIDGWSISCKIVLKWMPMDLTDGKSTLVQVMAWCRQATSHYPSQCWPRSLSPYDVTRPQWVNWLRNNNVYLGKPILEIWKSR